MVWFLCVHGPLLDPWLSWAFVWTRFIHEDPIGSCSYLFPGQWFSCEHRWIPWLFLFSFSLTSLSFLLAMGRAGSVLPPCLGVQISVRRVCGSSGMFIATHIVECCVCTVNDIIMGERGCAIAHRLQPWPWLGMFSSVPDIAPRQKDCKKSFCSRYGNCILVQVSLNNN